MLMQVSDLRCLKSRVSFRRPHSRSRDGPFPLDRGSLSTRAREVDALNRRCGRGGSDIGPGQYDGGVAKDTCLRNVHTGARIGSSSREAIAPRVLSPSISTTLAASPAHRDCGHSSCHDAAESRNRCMDLPMLLPVQAEPGSLHMEHPRLSKVVVGNALTPPGSVVMGSRDRKKRREVDVGCSLKQDRLLRPVHKNNGKIPSWKYHQVPCPAVLSVEAARCKQPGSWNWVAVARSIRSTFTKQDGGCHTNPRSQTAVEHVHGNSAVGVHHGGRQRNIAPVSQSHGQKSALHREAPQGSASTSHGDAEPGGVAFASMRLSQHDIESHQLASEAAAAAQAVDLRQKQWQLQSALLPLMKQGMIDHSCHIPPSLASQEA